MSEVESRIQFLESGDIFNASTERASFILCLVEKIVSNVIYARRITDGDKLRFDAETGVEICVGPSKAVINSVSALPIDIHNVLIGLDRRSRLNDNSMGLNLSRDEMEALRFVQNHFSATKFT